LEKISDLIDIMNCEIRSLYYGECDYKDYIKKKKEIIRKGAYDRIKEKFREIFLKHDEE